jgi:hypothetical protein
VSESEEGGQEEAEEGIQVEPEGKVNMRIQRLILTVLAGCLALLVFLVAPALATYETPVTLSANGVTTTTAVLHGELNPGKVGEAGQWQFYYKPSTELCRPGAETFPEPPGTTLGAEKEAVETEVTNLEPETTYAFCLIENGASPFAQGVSLTFTTLALPPEAPTVGSENASAVTPFAATLEAQINPNRQPTSYKFEYSTTEAAGELTGTITTVDGKAPLPAGKTEVTASVSTGNVLTPDTIYYYRVVAENAQSKAEHKLVAGPVQSFETLTAEEPFVEEESVSGLKTSEPKVTAEISPNYQETEYQLEYAASKEALLEGKGVVIKGAPPAPKLPGVSAMIPVDPIGIPGLEAGPTYWYRFVATNATSTSHGEPESFQLLAAPLDSTGLSQEATRTTADVSGTVTPQGMPTTYHFAYIPQAEYEAAVAKGEPNPYAGGKSTYETKLAEENGTSIEDYTAHPVGLTIEELAPGTTYDYALVASNELGTIVGANHSFTTAARTAPVAITGGAVGVSQLSGTITGSVDTRELQTAMQFEFGTTPYAGAMLPATVVSSEGSVRGLAVVFSGELQPATTYDYRVVASNQDGVEYGAEQSFTTPGFPAAFPAATVIPLASYTSIGTLDANEAKEGKATAPKSLTRAQELAKALKACKRSRGKQRQAACERQARAKYGSAKRTEKK